MTTDLVPIVEIQRVLGRPPVNRMCGCSLVLHRAATIAIEDKSQRSERPQAHQSVVNCGRMVQPPRNQQTAKRRTDHDSPAPGPANLDSRANWHGSESWMRLTKKWMQRTMSSGKITRSGWFRHVGRAVERRPIILSLRDLQRLTVAERRCEPSHFQDCRCVVGNLFGAHGGGSVQVKCRPAAGIVLRRRLPLQPDVAAPVCARRVPV